MKERALIQLVLGAVILSGTAAESTRAGLLDDLVKKAKNKAETQVRAEANEIIGQIESVVEQEIETVVGGEGLVSDAVRNLSAPVPEGFLDGGSFFLPPAGVSNRAEIQSLLLGRQGPQRGNYVELLRRQAQDAYYEFWASWYATMEQTQTTLDILREQQKRLTLFGAGREAERTAAQIRVLEEQLRALAQSPHERETRLGQDAPLALFGLNVRSDTTPKEVLIAGASQIVALLDAAASRPNTEAVQQGIYDLARDVTAIRDRLEADDLEAAQAMMDRRWAWVLAD